MSDEPLYTCPYCDLTWKESQLYTLPPWAPEDRCPNCYGPVRRKDYGDLPMWRDLPVDPGGDVG